MNFIKEITRGDGLNLRWAHAVNSQSRLQSAFAEHVNGLEADVILRNEGTDKQEMVPVMAHPPVIDSDLTLEEFLQKSADYGKAIIKLDFKSILAVEMSLQVLDQMKTRITTPIWLNADIVQGPGSSTSKPVPHARFLEKATKFEGSTLSLGWTTSTDASQNYQWSHVNDMYKILKKYGRAGHLITFPVNAALLRNSLKPLKWLCEKFDASLTIFQSKTEDPVNISELVYVRKQLPKTHLFYDLQENTTRLFKQEADNMNLLTDEHKMVEGNHFDTSSWILKVTNQETSELRLGSEVIWLRGAEAIITSSRQFSSQTAVTVKGVVTFVADKESSQVQSKLQIYFYGEDRLSSNPSGIKVTLTSLGRMTVSSDLVPEQKIYYDDDIGLAKDDCYNLDIKVSDFTIEFSVYIPQKDCHVLESFNKNIHKHKTITAQVSKSGLISPYRIIMRNSKSGGYAVLEQFIVDIAH